MTAKIRIDGVGKAFRVGGRKGAMCERFQALEGVDLAARSYSEAPARSRSSPVVSGAAPYPIASTTRSITDTTRTPRE